MNKLFGLFLLALACWAPDVAQAAARFAVCSTTCSWDNTSTAMWSTSSGGATGASAPVAGDTVTLDAATCVGGTTCTITTFAGTISATSITWGACTASTTGCIIDASVNNTNFTLSNASGGTFSGTGTGTRNWKAGTGTYDITNTSSGNFVDMTTTTNSTSTFSGATWILSGVTTNARSFLGGAMTYGPTTINGNSSRGSLTLGNANTYSSLTINGPMLVTFSTSGQTVTGALTLSGVSSSSPVQIRPFSDDTPSTLSIGSASTGTWAAIRGITTSGAAALTVSNCFDLGRNTFANGGACNAPSGGGGGGGRIIGG